MFVFLNWDMFLLFCFCKVTEPAANFLFFWVNVFVFVGGTYTITWKKRKYESQFIQTVCYLFPAYVPSLRDLLCEVEFWEVFCLKRCKGFLEWLAPRYHLLAADSLTSSH